jgi:hypothetical protein
MQFLSYYFTFLEMVLLLRSFTVSSDVAVASSAKLLSPTRSGDSGWKAIV